MYTLKFDDVYHLPEVINLIILLAIFQINAIIFT